MIRHLQLKNFKALRDSEIAFDPFTVLVGPNASGKTSVLQALQIVLRALVAESTQDLKNIPFAQMAAVNATTPVVLDGDGLSQGHKWNVIVTASADKPSPTLRVEWFADGWRDSITSDSPSAGQQGASGPRAEELRRQRSEQHAELRAVAPSPILLRLNPERLSSPSYSEDEVPQLGEDGSGLASVLAYMKLSQPERFAKIEESLQKIISSARTIRIGRAKVNRRVQGNAKRDLVWGNTIELDFAGATRIPASQISEGTLLVLGILTAIESMTHPLLLLLDDLDRGVHPAAMKMLVEQLREFQKSAPEMQIVATTHSPYLIDEFNEHEVRLTTTDEKGSVVCAGLADHPEFDRWKETMLPGEFWSMVGEKWILEQKGHAHAGK